MLSVIFYKTFKWSNEQMFWKTNDLKLIGKIYTHRRIWFAWKVLTLNSNGLKISNGNEKMICGRLFIKTLKKRNDLRYVHKWRHKNIPFFSVTQNNVRRLEGKLWTWQYKFFCVGTCDTLANYQKQWAAKGSACTILVCRHAKNLLTLINKTRLSQILS